jgi:hypothetical protein
MEHVGRRIIQCGTRYDEIQRPLIRPGRLGRNAKDVSAIPARHNCAFPAMGARKRADAMVLPLRLVDSNIRLSSFADPRCDSHIYEEPQRQNARQSEKEPDRVRQPGQDG